MATFIGTPSNNSLNGTNRADTILGNGGQDTINARAGDDLVIAGNGGNDKIDGGAGGDTLILGNNFSDYTITFANVAFTDPSAGTFTKAAIILTNTVTGAVETVTGVENIIFDDASIRVVGAGSTHTTVQDGVNSADDGEIVLVAPGTYTEQVVIDGKTDVTVMAVAGTDVNIVAPADVHETVRSSSGRELNAVVSVVDSANVQLENINVDGAGHGNTVDENDGAGQANFIGVVYRNASGGMTDVDVTGIRDPYAGGTTAGGHDVVSGVQRGVGVQVDNDATLDFFMHGGSITDFQKNATVFNYANLDVTGVTVTGGGAQTIIAQNGIQVLNSTGTISGNTITGIGYAGPADAYSGAVLAYGNTDLTISNNTISGSNDESSAAKVVGIYALDFGTPNSGISITDNTISNVDEGIDVSGDVGSAGFTITGNSVTSVDLTDPYHTGVAFYPNASPYAHDVEGSQADDYLQGGDGADTLKGLGGDDTIIGGGGADVLEGGSGNDTYDAESADTIVETAGNGIDTVNAAANFTLAAGVSVENINSTGTGLSLTGNELAQTITGDSGSNTLAGGGGGDTLVGGGGIDTAVYGAGASIAFNSGTGHWEVTTGSGVDSLTGVEKVTVDTTTYVLVDHSGANGAYQTIQDGINAATIGEKVLVAQGTYTENVQFNKAVDVLGAQHGVGGADESRGAATGTGETTIVGRSDITASGAVTIDGLRFLNDATTTHGGPSDPTLQVQSGYDHVITNSVFWSTVAGGANGVDDRAISFPTIADGHVTISDNLISGSSVGGFVTASWGRGIWFDGAGIDLTVDGNTFQNVRSGINLDMTGDSTAAVQNNTFNTAGTAVAVGVDTDGFSFSNNSMVDVGDDLNLRNLASANFDATGIASSSTASNPETFNQYVSIIGGHGADTITGTALDDILDGNNFGTGNAENDADILNGGGGNDIILGKGGNDTLTGGAGDDSIDGGNGGGDTAVFSGNFADYTITRLGANSYRLVGPDGTDTVDNVESFQFADVTLTAEGIFNDAPVANDDANSAVEDGTPVVSGSVATNDTDQDIGFVPGESLSFAVTNGPIAGLQFDSDGSYTFDPTDAAYQHLAAGAELPVTVNYTVTDSAGNTDTAVLTITVTGTNDGPVAVADTAAGTENQTLTIDVLANDTDVDDGHSFTLVSASAPAHKGTATVVDGMVEFNPGADFDHLVAGDTETVTLSYTMEDEHGVQSSTTIEVTVTGTNDAATVSSETKAVSEGNVASALDTSGQLTITDPDTGEAHVVAQTNVAGTYGTFSIDASGAWTYTGNGAHDDLSEGQAVHDEFTVYSQDGTASGTVRVDITGTNDGPVAVADAFGSVAENQSTSLDVKANDSDADNSVASLSIVNITATGTDKLVGFDLSSYFTANPDGTIHFDPGAGAGGDLNSAPFGSENIFDRLDPTDSSVITVSYKLSDGLALSSTATATFTITGTQEVYIGDGNANTITGTNYQNFIDGGAGDDVMAGGARNDTYVVDSQTDTVTENANAGTDTVLSYTDTYTLSANVENLTLMTGASTGIGNALANVLTGNADNNILDGAGGVDTYVGGAGDDSFVIDNAAELAKITENADEGRDTVFSSVSFGSLASHSTLSANVEDIQLLGTAANAWGNALDNSITGNNFANIIDGGAGADEMVGGKGNDTYYVDNVSDTIIENAGEGTDSVNSSVSYTLAVQVENLTLTGAGDLNATGNAQNNILTGNSGANTLIGGNGNDTLIGNAGKDIMTGGNQADTFKFNALTDSATDNTRDQILDFSHAQGDKVDLSGIDANAGVAGDQAFTFLAGNAYTGTGNAGTPGQLFITTAGNNNIVHVDVNGDRVDDLTILVVTADTLNATDFIL